MTCFRAKLNWTSCKVKLSPTLHLVTLDLASHILPSEEALDSIVKGTL